jgi:hypothetical protein
MKTRPSGVPQYEATVAESPTTAMTTDSRPVAASAPRKAGSVSIRPSGPTSRASKYSWPGCCSSEPRWWSTENSTVPHALAAAPR